MADENGCHGPAVHTAVPQPAGAEVAAPQAALQQLQAPFQAVRSTSSSAHGSNHNGHPLTKAINMVRSDINEHQPQP